MTPYKTSIKVFIFMTLLTGLLYPLTIFLAAQFILPIKSNGSLILKENFILGAPLIAQNTPGDKYFWPRPSAIDYDPMKPSGGSNLAPTSQKLKEAVLERKKKAGENAPAELLYASGSGLDPHISLETAYYQIPRVAKARSMDEKELKKWVHMYKDGRRLIFLGTPYINVLLLNQALDERR